MKKLSRREILKVGAGFGLACAGAGWETWAAPAGAKVRMGTLVPKGSSSFRHLKAMGEKWEKASGGKVSLTIYADGTMGGEADMVRRMRVGQLQSGLLSVVGLSEIEPAVAGLQNMPMMFRTLEEVDYVTEKLRPMLEKRMQDKGFIPLFWTDAGWVRFFSKDPVIHPNDLKKTKLFVWAGHAGSVDIYKSGGFNAVPLETVDILPSLQTGLITAVPLPPFIALASQVDGPAPHMLELNWAPLVGACVVAKKIWDTLPNETREAMMNSARETGQIIKEDSRRESNLAVEAMKKRGLKMHPVTPEMNDEWRKATEPFYPKIRGNIVPPEIFDEIARLLEARRAEASK